MTAYTTLCKQLKDDLRDAIQAYQLHFRHRAMSRRRQRDVAALHDLIDRYYDINVLVTKLKNYLKQIKTGWWIFRTGRSRLKRELNDVIGKKDYGKEAQLQAQIDDLAKQNYQLKQGGTELALIPTSVGLEQQLQWIDYYRQQLQKSVTNLNAMLIEADSSLIQIVASKQEELQRQAKQFDEIKYSFEQIKVNLDESNHSSLLDQPLLSHYNASSTSCLVRPSSCHFFQQMPDYFCRSSNEIIIETEENDSSNSFESQ